MSLLLWVWFALLLRKGCRMKLYPGTLWELWVSERINQRLSSKLGWKNHWNSGWTNCRSGPFIRHQQTCGDSLYSGNYWTYPRHRWCNGLANLAMVTGNIGKPGSGLTPSRSEQCSGSLRYGILAGTFPGYQAVDNPEIRMKFENAWV